MSLSLASIQKSALKIVREIISRYSADIPIKKKKDAYNFYKNRILLKPEDYLRFQKYNPCFNDEQRKYFICKFKKKKRLLAFVVKC